MKIVDGRWKPCLYPQVGPKTNINSTFDAKRSRSHRRQTVDSVQYALTNAPDSHVLANVATKDVGNDKLEATTTSIPFSVG